MLSNMEKISANRVKLRLELDAETYNEAIQKAYYKLRGRYAVTGFRKGKAPRKLIERVYGEGVFHEEAINSVFFGLYEASVKEHGLKPVAPPEITEIETDSATEGLIILAELYVSPDVILGQYKGLNVSRDDVTVGEDAVEEAVAAARRRNAREVEVDDRPVADGDVVTLDFAGTVDGVAFEGGAAEKQKLLIGSHAYIPGFEEQMIGMRIGEEKDLMVKLPENYADETLAGKDAVFHVKALEIHMIELPELDDEFAKDLGYETLDEYKSGIRAKIEADSNRAADEAFESALLMAAADNAEIDIPEPMIERETDSMMNNFTMTMAYHGADMETYYQRTGQTAEGVRLEHRRRAIQKIKAELVLAAIAKEENVEPSQEDIDEVLNRLAQDYRKENDEDFRQSLPEEQMEMVRDTAKAAAVYKLLRREARPIEASAAEASKEGALEEAIPEEE